MIRRVVKPPKVEINDTPKVTKGSKDIWIVPVSRDKKEIKYRSSFKSKKHKKEKLKQFVYDKNEKSHYSCLRNLPIFNINDRDFANKKKYGHKRKGLGTLNGKVFDPDKINNEIDLLRLTTWFGFCHTEKKNHRYHEIMSNDNTMFDCAISGKITAMNHIFTYPVRDRVTGLLHKSSCLRKYTSSGKFLTLSYFPFDIEVSKKLRGDKIINIENLQKQGFLVDPDIYDPSTTKWYDYWYCGNKNLMMGMPNPIKGNELLIPMYHEVCSNSDIFETNDGYNIGFKSYLDMIFHTLFDNNDTKTKLRDLVTSQQNDFNENMDELFNYIKTDGIMRYKFERANFRINPSLKHLKVLGGAKEETVIKFGDEMNCQLLMECTK